MDGIPVLDLTQPDIIARFRDAYGIFGFAYITGHGISPGLVEQVFAANRAFHALPLEQKMHILVNDAHRGYIPIDTSTDRLSELAEVTRPNQSASFMMMREDTTADPNVYLSGPNQWPDLVGFQATLQSYVTAMSKLGLRLMSVALAAAGAEDDAALDLFAPPTIWLRLLHYPPQKPAPADDLYGSAPHTDFGALTLLAQDDVGGLQVQHPDGSWLDVPYLEGSFVVNVGDMLHRMSNGILRSTPHRVINRSGRERYSCPFFFDPFVTSSIAPVPGTGEPVFESIKFDTFLRRQLEASYDAHAQSEN